MPYITQQIFNEIVQLPANKGAGATNLTDFPLQDGSLILRSGFY